MTKSELAHPHDLLTRSILADPELAGSLLENYIEPGVVSLLDLAKLRCESPVNVDKNLKEIIGDLRFSTVFKRSKRQSNVFVFLEHQSSYDEQMAFRALKQIVEAYQEYSDSARKKGGRPMPFPFPVVVILYHGGRPWGKLKRMRDLVERISEIAGDILDFPMFLIDLSLIPPEELKGHPALQALLETLQLGSEGKLESGFDRVTDRLAAVRNDPRAPGWMQALVRYTISLCEIGTQAIIKAFSKILDEKEAEKMAMSTAQKLMLEGKTEGKIEGKKETILDVLEARFGRVPKTIRDTVNSYIDEIALKSLVVLASTCKSLDEFKDGLL